MYDTLKRFIMIILSALGVAVAQVAVDELEKYAYQPNQRRRPRYTSYGRMPYSGPRRSVFEPRVTAPKDMDEYDTYEKARVAAVRAQQAADNRFHDVLMVAFDIAGPNEALVHEWLANAMPAADEYENAGINVDAWWIADDGSEADQDSAVFVPKGSQAEARAALRRVGIID